MVWFPSLVGVFSIGLIKQKKITTMALTSEFCGCFSSWTRPCRMWIGAVKQWSLMPGSRTSSWGSWESSTPLQVCMHILISLRFYIVYTRLFVFAFNLHCLERETEMLTAYDRQNWCRCQWDSKLWSPNCQSRAVLHKSTVKNLSINQWWFRPQFCTVRLYWARINLG